MGNSGSNKVSSTEESDDFVLDFTFIKDNNLKLISLSNAKDANLKIISSIGSIYYVKYADTKTEYINLDMILKLTKSKKACLGNKFKDLLQINNCTLLSEYIIMAKKFNMTKYGVVYLPIL